MTLTCARFFHLDLKFVNAITHSIDRNSNRRNGKPASCEPCRKNKTKCDHTIPTCNRCHQRGITDKCFYHPAPLTKRPDTLVGDGQRTTPLDNVRKRKYGFFWSSSVSKTLTQVDGLSTITASAFVMRPFRMYPRPL